MNVDPAVADWLAQGEGCEGRALAVCSELLARLKEDEGALMEVLSRSEEWRYPQARVLDAAILSMRMALSHEFGWDDGAVVRLGAIALLHDAEVFGRLHPRRPVRGAAPIADVYRIAMDLPEEVRSWMRPVVSLAAAYIERLYPSREDALLSPHEALKTLLRKSKGEFPKRVWRSLIAQLSLYPPGTIVELSDGSVARTIGAEPRLPNRPRLEMLTDRGGASAAPGTTLALREHPELHITQALPPDCAADPDRAAWHREPAP